MLHDLKFTQHAQKLTVSHTIWRPEKFCKLHQLEE